MGLHLEFGVRESYWGFLYGSLEVIGELLGDSLFYFSFRVRWGSLKVIRESLAVHLELVGSSFVVHLEFMGVVGGY